MEYIFIPCLTFFRSHEGAKLGENPVQIQKFEGIPRISGFELVLKRIWHSPEVSAMSGALWKSVPPGTNRPEMSYLGQDTFLVWFLVPNSTPQKLWRSFPKILFQFFFCFFFHFFFPTVGVRPGVTTSPDPLSSSITLWWGVDQSLHRGIRMV